MIAGAQNVLTSLENSDNRICTSIDLDLLAREPDRTVAKNLSTETDTAISAIFV